MPGTLASLWDRTSSRTALCSSIGWSRTPFAPLPMALPSAWKRNAATSSRWRWRFTNKFFAEPNTDETNNLKRTEKQLMKNMILCTAIAGFLSASLALHADVEPWQTQGGGGTFQNLVKPADKKAPEGAK